MNWATLQKTITETSARVAQLAVQHPWKAFIVVSVTYLFAFVAGAVIF